MQRAHSLRLQFTLDTQIEVRRIHADVQRRTDIKRALQQLPLGTQDTWQRRQHLGVAADGKRFRVDPGIDAGCAHTRPRDTVKLNRRINAPDAFDKVGSQLVARGLPGDDHYIRHRLARKPPPRRLQESEQRLQCSADFVAGSGLLGVQHSNGFLQRQVVAEDGLVGVAHGGNRFR